MNKMEIEVRWSDIFSCGTELLEKTQPTDVRWEHIKRARKLYEGLLALFEAKRHHAVYQWACKGEQCAVFRSSGLVERPTAGEIANRSLEFYAADALEWNDSLLDQSQYDGKMERDCDWVFFEGPAEDLHDLADLWCTADRLYDNKRGCALKEALEDIV